MSKDFGAHWIGDDGSYYFQEPQRFDGPFIIDLNREAYRLPDKDGWRQVLFIENDGNIGIQEEIITHRIRSL